MFVKNIQSLIYECFMNLENNKPNVSECILEKPSDNKSIMRLESRLDSNGDFLVANTCYKHKKPAKIKPQIIICTSDEMDLCYQAVAFLLSYKSQFNSSFGSKGAGGLNNLDNENLDSVLESKRDSSAMPQNDVTKTSHNEIMLATHNDAKSQNNIKTQNNKTNFPNNNINQSDNTKIPDTAPSTKKTIQSNHLPILLPDIRLAAYDSTLSFYEEMKELFAKLAKFYENNCQQIIITPPHTIMNIMPSKELLHSFSISRQDSMSPQELAEKLILYGYESVEIVEMQGEFSLRGDILDIFIADSSDPVRLSFFDREIESMRYFNIQTQLSNKEELEIIKIFPAMFSLSPSQYELLESKINEKKDGISSVETSINAMGFWFLQDIGGINFLEHFDAIFTPNALSEYMGNVDFVLDSLKPSEDRIFYVCNAPLLSSDMDFIKPSNLASNAKLNKDKNICVISKSEALLKTLDFVPSKSIISPFYFNIRTSDSMFISLSNVQKSRSKKIALNIDSLKVGEFVIHSDYGIGIFECIKQIEVMGGLKDFVSIVYANEDRLLLPVENLNLIEKYSVYDSNVKLDKLGKSSFIKLKDSIKEKLLEIANNIISLQAQRELVKAQIIEIDSVEKMLLYKEFEQKRGFELTGDQNLAITESLNDFKSGRVMDRLLNGDVGFGKTEVAMSLCYACALNGFTSIVVVPTTLLAQQHFDTFKERLNQCRLLDRKLKVVKIDRFSSSKEKKEIEQALRDKEILIIIGTHAIFNLAVQNLGLLVIDEEHKFGVKQKEILKEKSLNTHVLSMSATPIPRTLNMAFSKLKSVSELREAPNFKQESKTFVKIKKDSLIKEAITRELRRGGQVFYIYNNIARIDSIRHYLLSLLPELKILVLHSKIKPQDTERGMLDFLHKKYDILLCTSIVESGIHLPNANTIIIDDAHNFGVADIHQLRGRVGRGRAVGYCYLLTREDIGSDATKRLLALEKNSYLGSGAAIAYQDLEIRGGGNLLGSAQSGHIKQVGFSMYVKMLEDTLSSLTQSHSMHSRIDLKLSISAFLNETLITSERMRLELYRRLSQAKSEREVREIESEIEQRFGKLDIYTLQFLELIIIKILALSLHVKAISNMSNNICITFDDNNKVYIKSETKDDDDVINAIKKYLKEMGREIA